MSGSRARRNRLVALALFSLMVATGSAGLAERASAAWFAVAETGGIGALVLDSDRHQDTLLAVAPGQVTYWQVAATVDDVAGAALSLALTKDGTLATAPSGLVVSIDECEAEWRDVPINPTCDDGAVHVLTASPAHDYTTMSPEWQLAELRGGGERNLLIGLTLPPEAANDPAMMAATGTVGLRIRASGDLDPADGTDGVEDGGGDTSGGGGDAASGSGDAGAGTGAGNDSSNTNSNTVPPVGAALAASGSAASLAVTGADLFPLLFAAVGLIGIGVVLASSRRSTR